MENAESRRMTLEQASFYYEALDEIEMKSI